MNLFAVITTIQPATPALRVLAERLKSVCSGRMIVAGDRKGPADLGLPGVSFLGLQDQLDGPFELARKLPTGHYCRKNIAYLEAIRQGADCLYETDDDNAPLSTWAPRVELMDAVRIVASSPVGSSPRGRWVNVYRYFSRDLIWPRGLPLDEIHTPAPEPETLGGVCGDILRAPIQQGLVNGSPDVDAVWRLTMDRPFEFENHPSIYLKPGNWCPFNTQSTWWWPVVYPLLYIPSHCSFRMCDIWRSFIAQRCLWELGLGIVFHSPEVLQTRNPHDLMRDFHDEIPGYEQNKALARVLEQTDLRAGEGGVAGNLFRCYEALVSHGILPSCELALVESWLEDLSVSHFPLKAVDPESGFSCM